MLFIRLKNKLKLNVGKQRAALFVTYVVRDKKCI